MIFTKLSCSQGVEHAEKRVGAVGTLKAKVPERVGGRRGRGCGVLPTPEQFWRGRQRSNSARTGRHDVVAGDLGPVETQSAELCPRHFHDLHVQHYLLAPADRHAVDDLADNTPRRCGRSGRCTRSCRRSRRSSRIFHRRDFERELGNADRSTKANSRESPTDQHADRIEFLVFVPEVDLRHAQSPLP